MEPLESPSQYAPLKGACRKLPHQALQRAANIEGP